MKILFFIQKLLYCPMFKLKQHIINYAKNCHNDSLIVLRGDKHDRYMSFLNKLEAICDREISEDLTHDQLSE